MIVFSSTSSFACSRPVFSLFWTLGLARFGGNGGSFSFSCDSRFSEVTSIVGTCSGSTASYTPASSGLVCSGRGGTGGPSVIESGFLKARCRLV
uniref:Putative secreted protein n=1 Tax=Anopheles darlingi TaxID=43151 RepID=A0A2M4DRR8_ANODA